MGPEGGFVAIAESWVDFKILDTVWPVCEGTVHMQMCL